MAAGVWGVKRKDSDQRQPCDSRYIFAAIARYKPQGE